MTDQNTVYRFECNIRATPDQVFDAFTSGTSLREWFCDFASTDPRTGGRVYLVWNSGFYAAGEFTRFEMGKSIHFTWFGRGEPAPSEVCIDLSAHNGSTTVTLEHKGVGVGDEWESTIEEVQMGWNDSLENLASYLETGLDLRFIRRPMLGITVSDFNEETAAQLGIPVHQGIRLDSVVEGMGAAKAGLQNNDVIVELAGLPIIDWPSLANALQGQRAGDVVEVVFYREGKKRSMQMKLSGRPIPELPASAAELADAVRKRYEKCDSDLESFFVGVTEEEASFHAAPGEWSAKEVLAHLIHSERGLQNWLAEVIAGQEALYDNFPDNVLARVQGTAEAYGTIPALIAEVKCAEQEVIGILAHLPEDFMARKGRYWRVAFSTLEAPYHLYTHLDQMKASIQAARRR